MPAARCDAVNGVTQFGSLQPSISTLALSGCESNFNSLCWMKTLFGELVAFTGVGSFCAFADFFVGKNFTVVSEAMTSLFSGVGAGMAIAIGSRAALCFLRFGLFRKLAHLYLRPMVGVSTHGAAQHQNGNNGGKQHAALAGKNGGRGTAQLEWAFWLKQARPRRPPRPLLCCRKQLSPVAQVSFLDRSRHWTDRSS